MTDVEMDPTTAVRKGERAVSARGDDRERGASDSEKPPVTRRVDSRDWVPVFGYQNYWQPVLLSRRLGKRPLGVKAMGKSMVLFRDGKGVAALDEICPHRGARLSMGQCHFTGTVSCPYHGWTFDSEGRCVAALTDGPDSGVPERARVTSFPTREALGVIWVYLGDGEPPVFEEDLPLVLRKTINAPGRFSVFATQQDWRTDWRVTMDNAIDGAHAVYLHRPALIMLFNRIPAYVKLRVEPSRYEDPERFFTYVYEEAPESGEFPQLGRYPRRRWWRVRRQKFTGEVAIGLPGLLEFNAGRWTHIRWAVPVAPDCTRNIIFAIKEGSWPRRALFWFNFWIWLRWIFYNNFSAQDKWITESVEYANLERETLTRTDAPTLAWRKLSRVAR